jgi:hypothetical protein
MENQETDQGGRKAEIELRCDGECLLGDSTRLWGARDL